MPQTKFYAVGPHEGQTITLDRFAFVDGVYTFEGNDQDTAAVAKVLREQYQAVPEAEVEAAKKAYDEAQAEAALQPEQSPATLELSIKQRRMARRFIEENLDPAAVYGEGEAAEQMRKCIEHLKAEDKEGNDVLTDDELKEREEAAKAQAEKERLEKEAADKAKAEAAEKAAADEKAKAEADEAAKKAAEDAAKQQGEGSGQQQDNGGGEQQPEGAKIETVADALQALDPANDEHWTSRGVPSIDAMTKLLGRTVTRAEIEAVAPDYTRSVAKAAKAAA